MDLQNAIKSQVDLNVKEFIYTIADHYNLDYKSLFAFLETCEQTSAKNAIKMTCMHKMLNGVNKGNFCQSNALENGYCGKHQKSASSIIGTIVAKTANTNTKIKGMTKTQMNIIEWLNTAVPQTESVLKRHSKGLHHEETDIIFNEEFQVIGKLENDKIVKLSNFEVEICEKRGWQYELDSVEIEED